MTEIPPAQPEAHPWDAEFAKLREHFANATDGVLFCIHKLQQDPAIKLGDFKPEADLHGLKVTGASFHSARVMLGLEKRRARRPKEVGWERAERRLEKEFPDATTGIRFCVFKLRQDPSLRIADFRTEAAEHGIKLGGRALHSARKLLDIGSEPRGATATDNGSKLERELQETLARVQEQANGDAERLREAIRKAIAVLEGGLG